MNLQEAFIKVLIKVAMADEKLHVEELNLIRRIRDGLDMEQADLNELIRQSRDESLEEIIKTIEKYEDRLFTLQHAYYLALVDKEYHEKEREMMEYLITALNLSREDVRRIENSAELISQGQYAILTNPDIAYLHNNFFRSSFAAALLE